LRHLQKHTTLCAAKKPVITYIFSYETLKQLDVKPKRSPLHMAFPREAFQEKPGGLSPEAVGVLVSNGPTWW